MHAHEETHPQNATPIISGLKYWYGHGRTGHATGMAAVFSHQVKGGECGRTFKRTGDYIKKKEEERRHKCLQEGARQTGTTRLSVKYVSTGSGVLIALLFTFDQK